MKSVLDAGALLALERGDRAMWRRLRAELAVDENVLTHGGVVGQTWRGGSGRQALLARALGFMEVAPLDEALGRTSGVLLARAGASDVVDAAVVALCDDDDVIYTSDPDDLAALVDAAGVAVDVVPV